MNVKSDESMLDPALSEVYRETANIDSPARLDARVLRESREAVAPYRHRWWKSVALAATVVLAIGLGLQLYVVLWDRPETTLQGPVHVDAAAGAVEQSLSGPCAGRRGQPGEWRLCIDELRQEGRIDDARTETAALEAASPPDVAGR